MTKKVKRKPRRRVNKLKTERARKLKELSLRVRERDKLQCQYCGHKGKYLSCHHCLPKLKYKQFMYDDNVCITLCRKCHFCLAEHDGLKFYAWLMEKKPEIWNYCRERIEI